MKRFALTILLASVTMSAPAYAQGKKVVTINPDGSVTISDPEGGATQTLPSPRAQPPRRQAPFVDALPADQQRALKQQQKTAPEAPADAPAQEEPAPQPVPVEKEQKTEKPVKPKPPKKKTPPAKPKTESITPVKKPVAEKPVTEKPLREQILTPDRPVTEMPSVPAPERPLVEEPVLDDGASAPPAREQLEGIIRGEPAAPQSLGRVDPKVQPRPIKVRGPITPDDAKRIALDIGPPARAVEAYPADYMGRKVFQVIFYTEQGERYVLVDRQTGEIVND